MSRASRRALLYAFIALVAGGYAALAAAARPASVKDAWVRAPAPGQQVAGAYLELTRAGASPSLIQTVIIKNQPFMPWSAGGA